MICGVSTTRTVSRIVGLIGCLLLWSGVAHAEGSGRDLFRLGLELFARGSTVEALEAFEAAYRAEPLPAILYNIAMCQRANDRPTDSVNTFRRYLEEENPERISDEDRQDIMELLDEMRGHHGDIVVHVSVDGSMLFIDGQEVGESPLNRPVAVSPGEHVVLARRDGYRPDEATVVVGAGEEAVATLSLESVGASNPGVSSPFGAVEPVENETDTAPVRGEEPRLGWWFWTFVGLGGASAVSFIATGAVALSLQNTLDDSGGLDYDAADAGEDLALATDILILASALMAAAVLTSGIVYRVRQVRYEQLARRRGLMFAMTRAPAEVCW